ncbi:toll-like receptor 5 isoform X2 [Gouania willdenowi]|nr:toll-like receptor 5 isoform X2 [Gouania willdenowi]
MGSVANCAARRLRSVPPLPPHITHLYLEMNHISELGPASLSGLHQLQELDVGKQTMPLAIRNKTFRGLGKLRRLVLGFNRGLHLEPLAFEGLSALQDLRLDYCSLNESILGDSYLQTLSSLQTLDLFGNNIKKLQPAPFFANMTKFKSLNLKLNTIDRICESDLAGFRGKHFSLLNLNSIHLKEMSNSRFDWQKCGNPFRGISFEMLDLSNNGLSVDQCGRLFQAIKTTKISHLKISGHIGKGFSFNNLPDPDSSTFKGLSNSSILSLDLSKNRIFALKPAVFSHLKEVVVINISQNKVNQIDRGAFEGLQGHLRMLNLSHNLLGEIHSHTFASLTNLRVLDLSHNHIGVLGFGSFRGLPQLKMLYLTGNSLRDFGFPAALPSLNYLMLNDNRLTPLSVRGVSLFARNVTHLNIGKNRLTNLGDVHTLLAQMKNLNNFFFGGNTIRSCTSTPTGLNDLQLLDLHSSSLQSIWAQRKCLNLFDDLGRVTGLNLSHNALRSLPKDVFKGLTSLLELDLSFNTLTHLQHDVIPGNVKILRLVNNFLASPDPVVFSTLSYLDLKMNRFFCDSSLRSFLLWMNSTNVTFLSSLQELRCGFPSGFFDVPLIAYSAQNTLQ